MKNYIELYLVELVHMVEDEFTQEQEKLEEIEIQLPKLIEETISEWLPVEELISVLTKAEWKKVTVLDRKEVYVTDENLEKRIEELESKLDNARNFFDNISSHLDDLRSTMSDLDYYVDEAQEDCDYGQDECYY